MAIAKIREAQLSGKNHKELSRTIVLTGRGLPSFRLNLSPAGSQCVLEHAQVMSGELLFA